MSAPSPTCGGTSHMLPAERARASFDSAKLERLIRGDRQDKIRQFQPLFSGPPFDSQHLDYFRSYADLSKIKIERVAEAVRITRDNPEFMMAHIKQEVAMADMFESSHLGGIHFSMFLTYVQTQASPEQQAKWLKGARSAQYFGAYAQTELGHGSNVRGLETTATFDPATDEFIINSPTLTSLKWWPTGMYACTHGVVFARLILHGKDYGFHGFFMQFRDDQGKLMPGVEIGEIGPKVNGQHANIGYARFTHVAIPRFNMFAKYQQVDREGNYHKAPRELSKFKYISMMTIRVTLVATSFVRLSQAATIAIRYSCVRKQGFKNTQSEGEAAIQSGEHVVMDYTVQKYRLFRGLALAYAFLWNAKYIADYLKRVQNAIVGGDLSAADELPELHATLSGLKVWSTLYAHDGIEDARKACGGQGFLLSSGIAEMSRSFAEAVTVEGEQVILSLQAARFLIKSAHAVKSGKKVAGSVTYLSDPAFDPKSLQQGFDGSQRSTDVLLALLKDRASRVSYRLAAAFDKAMKTGKTFDASLNSVALLAYKAAECHSMFVMARNNDIALKEYVQDPAALKALRRCYELFLLQQVYANVGDWVGILTERDVDNVYDRSMQLLDEIRPDAVALVDAFGWTDFQLYNSAIGKFDGNVYEAIYERARLSPLNQDPKMQGWEELSTVLDLDFIKEGMKSQRARL